MTPEEEAEVLELEIAVGEGAPKADYPSSNPVMATNRQTGVSSFAGTPETFRHQMYGEEFPRTTGSKARATLQGVGDASMFGWFDEATAAVLSLHPDWTYEQAHAETKKRVEEARERDPQSFFLGNVGGGATAGASVMPKTVWSALGLGGLEGAAYGAGSAEEGSRLGEAGKGAGIGLAISSVFPSAGAIYNFYKSGRGRGSEFIKGDIIQQSIDNSGLSPEEIALKAQQYGPESTSFANVAGDAGAGTARGVSQQTPEAARKVSEATRRQTGGIKPRVRNTLEGLSKRKGSYWSHFRKLKKDQKTRAEKYYGEAMSQDILPEKGMPDFLNKPGFAKAWKDAQKVAEMDDRILPKIYDYDDAGKAFWTGERMPKMEDLQYMDQYLYDMIKGSKRSGDATAPTMTRLYTKLRRELNDTISAQNPEYGKAKQIFSGDQNTRDALDLGRVASTTNVDDRLEDIRTMTRSEKDAYLSGILSDFRHRLGGTEADKAVSVNFMNNENMKETIMALMPNSKKGRKAGQDLFNRLSGEAEYKRTAQIASGGSKTADNIALESQIGKQAADAYVNVVSPKISMLGAAIDFVSKPNIKKEMWGDLADLLITPGKTEEALKVAKAAGATKAQVDTMKQFMRNVSAVATPVTLPTVME